MNTYKKASIFTGNLNNIKLPQNWHVSLKFHLQAKTKNFKIVETAESEEHSSMKKNIFIA